MNDVHDGPSLDASTADDGDAGTVETTGMVRPGSEPGSTPAQALLRLLVLTAVGALLLSTVAGAWMWLEMPSHTVVVAAGPVTDLRPSLAESASDPGFLERSSGWLVTTVTAASLSNAGALRHRLVGDHADRATVDPASQADASVAAQLSMEHTKRLAPALAANLRDGSPLPTATSLQVVRVEPGLAAARSGLAVADVIVAVDGGPATVVALAAALASGEALSLTVSANGAGAERTVAMPAADAYGLQVMPWLDAPRDLFDLSGVTGGSGGLIMTLAVLDATGPGDLTAGGTVSGTGAIDVAGAVLPVEGATQKARAAAAAGATVFFHPAAAPPVDPPDGLAVVAVDTVADALEWLCGRGSDDSVCAR